MTSTCIQLRKFSKHSAFFRESHCRPASPGSSPEIPRKRHTITKRSKVNEPTAPSSNHCAQNTNCSSKQVMAACQPGNVALPKSTIGYFIRGHKATVGCIPRSSKVNQHFVEVKQWFLTGRQSGLCAGTMSYEHNLAGAKVINHWFAPFRKTDGPHTNIHTNTHTYTHTQTHTHQTEQHHRECTLAASSRNTAG